MKGLAERTGLEPATPGVTGGSSALINKGLFHKFKDLAYLKLLTTD
jgi:hypothetical protein